MVASGVVMIVSVVTGATKVSSAVVSVGTGGTGGGATIPTFARAARAAADAPPPPGRLARGRRTASPFSGDPKGRLPFVLRTDGNGRDSSVLTSLTDVDVGRAFKSERGVVVPKSIITSFLSPFFFLSSKIMQMVVTNLALLMVLSLKEESW